MIHPTSPPMSPATRAWLDTPLEYENILVPLDGTAFAELAVRPAAELASATGAALVLGSVLDIGVQHGSLEALEAPPPYPAEAQRRRERLLGYLASTKERVLEDWSVPVDVEMMSGGKPSDVLAEEAQSRSISVIVANSHARGLLATSVVGSTIRDLVRRAPCPVFLIGSEDSAAERTPPTWHPPSAIVAAVDPAEHLGDAVVLEHSAALAQAWGSRIEVVQVRRKHPRGGHRFTSPPPPDADGHRAARPAAPYGNSDQPVSGRLSEALSELSRRGLEVRARVLTGGRPADAVVEFAQSVEADLVVVGRHDKSLFDRILLGSESERVYRRAGSVAVMICPLSGDEAGDNVDDEESRSD